MGAHRSGVELKWSTKRTLLVAPLGVCGLFAASTDDPAPEVVAREPIVVVCVCVAQHGLGLEEESITDGLGPDRLMRGTAQGRRAKRNDLLRLATARWWPNGEYERWRRRPLLCCTLKCSLSPLSADRDCCGG